MIGSAAAADANKNTADVKRAYKHHLIFKDISRICALPFPCSINPSDAAQYLTRSIEASASDFLMMCNYGSHEGSSSINWTPSWEYPLEKSLAHAITPDKPTTTPVTPLMEYWPGQVSRALAARATGPAAFTLV